MICSFIFCFYTEFCSTVIILNEHYLAILHMFTLTLFFTSSSCLVIDFIISTSYFLSSLNWSANCDWFLGKNLLWHNCRKGSLVSGLFFSYLIINLCCFSSWSLSISFSLLKIMTSSIIYLFLYRYYSSSACWWAN